jgi:hypothetical protein
LPVASRPVASWPITARTVPGWRIGPVEIPARRARSLRLRRGARNNLSRNSGWPRPAIARRAVRAPVSPTPVVTTRRARLTLRGCRTVRRAAAIGGSLTTLVAMLAPHLDQRDVDRCHDVSRRFRANA